MGHANDAKAHLPCEPARLATEQLPVKVEIKTAIVTVAPN
jgi:hypothetical protein